MEDGGLTIGRTIVRERLLLRNPKAKKHTHTPNRTLVKIDTNYPNWLTSYNDHQKLTFSVIYLFITGSYSGTFQ